MIHTEGIVTRWCAFRLVVLTKREIILELVENYCFFCSVLFCFVLSSCKPYYCMVKPGEKSMKIYFLLFLVG